MSMVYEEDHPTILTVEIIVGIAVGVVVASLVIALCIGIVVAALIVRTRRGGYTCMYTHAHACSFSIIYDTPYFCKTKFGGNTLHVLLSAGVY